MTPDFAEFILRTPASLRTGRVFKINGLYTGKPMSEKRVSRVVSAIGKKANVVVEKAKNKFATAHDLRRAFGTRWATHVAPAVLQRLLRHASIDTTMRFYVNIEAADIADDLWKRFGVNTFVNTCDNSADLAVSNEPAESPEPLDT